MHTSLAFLTAVAVPSRQVSFVVVSVFWVFFVWVLVFLVLFGHFFRHHLFKKIVNFVIVRNVQLLDTAICQMMTFSKMSDS